MMRRALLILAIATAGSMRAGCTPPSTPIPPPGPTQPPSMKPRSSAGVQPAKLSVLPDRPSPLRVDIYQISVPLGTVSRNEQFWKRIDETCIDVATCDLLQKNGVRVGVAPTDEWDYF